MDEHHPAVKSELCCCCSTVPVLASCLAPSLLPGAPLSAAEFPGSSGRRYSRGGRLAEVHLGCTCLMARQTVNHHNAQPKQNPAVPEQQAKPLGGFLSRGASGTLQQRLQLPHQPVSCTSQVDAQATPQIPAFPSHKQAAEYNSLIKAITDMHFTDIHYH